MQRSIKKDYFWNTLGVLLQNAISPLLLIVVTRVNGIYDSGVFSFAFSVAIIFWVFGMWGGRTYQVSDIKREFSHRSYIMVRLILTLFMIVGAVIFVMANNYDLNKSSIIIALVVFKAFESIADAIHGVLQIGERLYVVGKSLCYKAVSGFILFAVIDLWTGSTLLSCLGIVAANVFFILFYDLKSAKKLDKIKIEPHQFNETVKKAIAIMKRTWPVSTVVFLSLLALNIPRYFIDLYHSDEIGYFGILAMPVTLVSLLVAFLLQPKVVHMSKLYDIKDYKGFGKSVGGLLFMTSGIGIIILLVVYIAGLPLLHLIFGVDFSGYLQSLLILFAGGIVSALVSIFINVFTIIRHFRYQFFILSLTNLALVFLSAAFIKDGGLEVGVFLFFITNITQLALMFAAYKVTLTKIATTRS